MSDDRSAYRRNMRYRTDGKRGHEEGSVSGQSSRAVEEVSAEYTTERRLSIGRHGCPT